MEVRTGVDLSAQGGDVLRRIVRAVDDLHVMVQQIASATEETAATSDEIKAFLSKKRDTNRPESAQTKITASFG